MWMGNKEGKRIMYPRMQLILEVFGEI